MRKVIQQALNRNAKTRNKEKSSIRVRVEHVFGLVENSMNGSIVRTIGIARAKANPDNYRVG